MTANSQLKRLFKAYALDDVDGFHKIAEEIIADQAAANKHAAARDLKKALMTKQPAGKIEEMRVLSPISIKTDNIDPVDFIRWSEDFSFDDTYFISSKKTYSYISRINREYVKRYTLASYGLRNKSRLLFWGPPGCGKTLAAQHIGYSLGLPVGTVKLESVISSLMGSTAKNIQKIFEYASENPMILLIDEFDSLGKARDDSKDVGEARRIVSVLLTSLENFKSKDSIIIATTNHEDILDSALWRRFDEVIQFEYPSPGDREKLIRKLLNGVKFSGSMDMVIRNSSGLSHAEIEIACKDALKTWVMDEMESVTSSLLTSAFNHRKSFQISSSKNFL